MPVNYLNDIILIFLHHNTHELSDGQLSTDLKAEGRVCSTEDIQRTIQSIGAPLFQFRLNKRGRLLIHIEPKVSSFNHFDYILSCILDEYMSRFSYRQMFA